MKNRFLLLVFICLAFICKAQTRDTIKTNSGLKYIPIVKGNGVHPKDGQKVKVIYHIGTLMSGMVFDKDADSPTIKFTLGQNEVIKGWEEGFKLMSKGERGVLIIPSKLAYGKAGVKDPDDETKYKIPPDSDLIFDVELVDFK